MHDTAVPPSPLSFTPPAPSLPYAGTVNSIGHSLSGELLDVDGDVWQAPEGDPMENQESSSPFRIMPYHSGASPDLHPCCAHFSL